MNTLRLTPSRELPRVLVLTRTDFTFTAAVHGRSGRGRMRVYASGRHITCSLDYRDGPALWIGNAAFDVTAKEAEKIRAAFPDLRVSGQPNPGGTGLEQSPSDCGDGCGDSGLTPGGAGGGRAPGSPISAEVV